MRSTAGNSLRVNHADTVENIPSHQNFSLMIWGLDWSTHLPKVVTSSGVVVEHGTFGGAAPFIAANYERFCDDVPADARFLESKSSEARRRYYERCGDVFQFRDNDRTVGVLVCTPVDWSTYYIRFVATLPEYRGERL